LLEIDQRLRGYELWTKAERLRSEPALAVHHAPEEMPIPVNPVENGDKQENYHLPLVAKVQNSFLTR